jgi:hypothetical protein
MSIRYLPSKCQMRSGPCEKEMVMYVALFWGVALPVLGWLALEIAEWGEY